MAKLTSSETKASKKETFLSKQDKQVMNQLDTNSETELENRFTNLICTTSAKYRHDTVSMFETFKAYSLNVSNIRSDYGITFDSSNKPNFGSIGGKDTSFIIESAAHRWNGGRYLGIFKFKISILNYFPMLEKFLKSGIKFHWVDQSFCFNSIAELKEILDILYPS